MTLKNNLLIADFLKITTVAFTIFSHLLSEDQKDMVIKSLGPWRVET